MRSHSKGYALLIGTSVSMLSIAIVGPSWWWIALIVYVAVLIWQLGI